MKQKRSITNQLTLDIQNYLFKKRIFAWRQNVTGIPLLNGCMRPASKKGIPDLLGCARGHFFGIEVKTGADRLSDAQKGFIASTENSGGRVFVAHNLEDLKRDFEEWDRESLLVCFSRLKGER